MQHENQRGQTKDALDPDRGYKLKLVKSLVFIFFCLYLPSAWAAQVEFHPSLSLGQQYTDNLFLTDRNPQADVISNLTPGIVLNYSAPAAEIALDYSWHYQLFRKHREENLDRFVDVQRAQGTALFLGGRPFQLRMTGNITREALDTRDNTNPLNDLANKSTVYHLSVAPEYRWQLRPSFSLVFAYLYDRIEVIDAVEDSEGHTGSLALEKQLSRNTLVSGRYSYLQQQTDTDDNYTQQDFTLGVTRQFGPRLSAEGQAGVSLVQYTTRGNKTSPNWYLGLSYQLSPPLSMKLALAQKFQLSSFEGLNEVKSATASLRYTRERIEGNAELSWSDVKFEQDARQDQTLGAKVKLRLLFSKALFCDLDVNIERAKLKPTNEQVDRYGFGGDLGFEYRRFLLTNGYSYRFNNSDLPAKDYRNMIVSLNATLRF